ncbi:MAG: hypothetical protein QF535_01910, partial [Anaerolineales bacterium]|nr:hypothetical protein [Anaerolineales bacterium]
GSNLNVDDMFYNVIKTGGQRLNCRTAPTIANDLSVLDGEWSQTSSNLDLTVSGNVIIDSAEIEGYAADLTFGSLTISGGGIYDATSELTTITSDNASDYVIQNSGTFTHNSGTVLISSSTGQKIVSDDYFYNLTVKDDSGGLRWLPSALLIANDLEVSNGASLRPENSTNTLTVSGTATVQDTSSYLGPLHDTYIGSHTLGALTIGTNGTYYAPGSPGTTYINTTMTNNGTFTHHSGTVYFDTGSSFFIATATTVEPVFYNLTYSGASSTYLYDDITVENLFLNPRGYIRLNNSKTLTLGTTGSQGTFDLANNRFYPMGTYYIYGASELYPAILTGTHANPVLWRY